MKRILLFILSVVISFPLFSQEEIWGYQSSGGDKGGGLVYKLDLENYSAETIHRFGYSLGFHGYFTDNPLIDGGNGIFYSTAKLTSTYVSYYSYYYKNILISFNPETNQVKHLQRIPENLEFAYCDIDEQIIYFWLDDIYDTELYKYDLINDTVYKTLDIDSNYGKVLAGNWLKEDGKYYFFTVYSGTNDYGTFLEYNPETNVLNKIFDFNELKNPQGSLLKHPNGMYYGTTQRGGENNFGSILKIDIADGSYEKLIDFTEETGTAPNDEAIIANDGNIYGLARRNGEYRKGSIYKYNPYANTLEALYYFDPDSYFYEGHVRSYKINYNGGDKFYFLMEAYDYIEESKGYLMSFNIETNEISVEHDFHNSDFFRPKNKLTYYNDSYFGIVSTDQTYEEGGIFRFDPSNSQLEFTKRIEYDSAAITGQNPYWLCQGPDGDLYGITCYGGAGEDGIVFTIDTETKEFQKLIDLYDLGLDGSSFRIETFLLNNGNILCFGNDDQLKAYEFDIINLEFTERFELDEDYYPKNTIKMNSRGNLYFTGNKYQNRSYFEYDLENDTLIKYEIYADSNIKAVFEKAPDVYYGITPKTLFKWNKVENTVDSLSNAYHISQEARNSFFGDLYMSKNNLLYGEYTEGNNKSYYKEYNYNIVENTFDQYSDVGVGFSLREYKDICETEEKLVVATFSSTNEIKMLNFSDETKIEFPIEKPPFFINVGYHGSNIGVYTYHVPIIIKPSIGLIKINSENRLKYWTGIQDSIWSNQNNWYKGRMPEGDEQIVIARSAENVPFINHFLEVSDLYIQKEAKVNIGSNGALTCSKLNNEGEINLFGNQRERGSFICEEPIDKGQINYTYLSDQAEEKILAMPVSEMSYSGFDSLKIWKYQNKEWHQLTDTNEMLNCHQIYQFEIDSSSQLQFSGEANRGDIEFNFDNIGLQPIPNPYTASLNWDEFNLSNLSHKTLYRFHEEDSTFSPYIDGLGSHPLIQPLDVVWVYAEPNESVRLETEKLMHASDYDSTQLSENKLVIRVDGETASDFTYIRFNENASRSFDSEYDARKIILEHKVRPMIFTYADTTKLSINQLPDTSMLEMAVSALTTAKYHLSIEQAEQFDFVYLEDLILNTKTDLLKGDYSFDYFTSDGNYPFRLYFKKWATEPLEASDVDMYFYLNKLVFSSRKQIEYADITFFDLVGRAVLDFKKQDFNRFTEYVNIPSGHYIVQFKSGDVVLNLKVFVL